MKACELMIGDLVRIWGQNRDITAKPHWFVRKIKADWLEDMLRREDKAKFFEEHNIIVPHPDIGDTEPIPLTAEILKANGFRFKNHDNEWWHYDPFPFSDFQIGYEDDCDMRVVMNSSTTNIRVNFVHELQHALRMCGLRELADNFKI